MASTALVESGAIGSVTNVTPCAEGSITDALTPGTPGYACNAGVLNSIDPIALTVASHTAGPAGYLPQKETEPKGASKSEMTRDAGITGREARLSGTPGLPPTGRAEVVTLAAQPTVTLEVSGKIGIGTCIAVFCGAEQQRNGGKESRPPFCKSATSHLLSTLPISLASRE